MTRSEALITTCKSWLTIRNGGPNAGSHGFNQPVKRSGTGLVETLRRLIQQQSGYRATPLGRGPAKHPLKLPARKGRHLATGKVSNTRFREGRSLLLLPEAFRNRRTVIGNGLIEMQPLRHIPDPQARWPETTAPLATAASAPINARRNVDLPDPFGPTMVTISPGSITAKSMPCKTVLATLCA